MENKDAFALLMTMRTGKTKVTIDDWQRSLDRSGGVLVVTAPAGVYRVWVTELNKHLEHGVLERSIVAVWDSKLKMKSIAPLFQITKRPKILIANIEAFSVVQEVRDACAALLQMHPQSMLVIDESTTILRWEQSGKGSHRAQSIHNLRPLAGKVRILSGLPTPRSPLDLWGQFEFLKPGLLGFISYKAFQQRYAIVKNIIVGGKFHIPLVVRYTDKIDELWSKLEPWSYRKRLEDCADVPPKLYVTREVEMTPVQERLYRQMEATATAEIRDGVFMSSQHSITTTLRLHQLCCGWATDDETKTTEQVPENRTNALLELLEDHDGKAIVWCSYTRDLQKVAASLERRFGAQSTVTFWGQNRDTREESSNRFKNDPDCRFIVATPGSGGRGRDWSEANLIVYYSNTDNLEHRDQSEERASSIQQTDRVTIVDFVTRDTVEWKIIYAMRKKIDLATVVLSDPQREWVV
jgi:SNF2 family DNA or RNA helicase